MGVLRGVGVRGIFAYSLFNIKSLLSVMQCAFLNYSPDGGGVLMMWDCRVASCDAGHPLRFAQ